MTSGNRVGKHVTGGERERERERGREGDVIVYPGRAAVNYFKGQ